MVTLSNTPSQDPTILHATYIAPTIPSASQPPPGPTHTFFTCVLSPSGTHQSLASSDSTVAKTAYLSELRRAVSSLQTEINEFLTARMEADNNNNNNNNNNNSQQPTSGSADRMKSEKERREEENYGEEVLDDED
ncbi:hypothetical protein ACJ72_05889 [Emergomyces africanus]|uniref:EKC/KEOPS complex subunit GON7 n=1 Tax=Emergomyces africanus TaxID=1955775 RepID=A0A1B7NSL8_9EURO|nr:hypothetical protein ACJ72_05889 [Emergomyces africanus]